jgi:hypothetical protein
MWFARLALALARGASEWERGDALLLVVLVVVWDEMHAPNCTRCQTVSVWGTVGQAVGGGTDPKKV